MWHAVGCLEQHGCCSIKSPLNLSRTFLLVVARVFGSHVVGCCVWGGVLCENCIVDANAIKKATINGCCLFFLFCGFVLGIFCCLCVKNVCVFCFLGAWWMPGYAKPMKDVIGCVKPRGVA